MAVRTYTFFNNSSSVTGTEKTLSIDFFSTISSAVLSWSAGDKTSSVVFNGKTISTNAKGSANVNVLNGQPNKLKMNVSFWDFTTFTAVLKVEGYLADFNIVKVQNETFVNAYKSGQISETEYQNAVNFQNTLATSMLTNGVITSAEYQSLVNVFLNAFPSITPDPNTSNPNTSNADNGDSGVLGSVKNWLSAKNVAVGGVVLVVFFVLLAFIMRSGGKK